MELNMDATNSGCHFTPPPEKKRRDDSVHDGNKSIESSFNRQCEIVPEKKSNKKKYLRNDESYSHLNARESETPPKRSCDLNRTTVSLQSVGDEGKRWNRDACYVEDDLGLGRVLNITRNEHPGAFVVHINNPSDLFNDDLLTRVHFHKDSETPLVGRLYSDEDVILVIDTRYISASVLAEFNELFDQPPRIRGEKLGPNVRIRTLVSHKMKPVPGESAEGKPSTDFWRRINNAQNRWSMADEEKTCTLAAAINLNAVNLDLPLFPSEESKGDETLEIDFLQDSNWRNVLLGYPKINETGQICYCHSPLSHAKGKKVIFKGAPWNDINFKIRLAGLLQSHALHVNGEAFSLEGCQFFHQPSSETAITELKKRVVYQPEPNDQMIMVNSENLDIWLSEILLEDGSCPIEHHPFIEVVKKARGIRVTSKLSKQQWLSLLCEIKKSGVGSCSLFIDTPDVQPEEFRPPETHQDEEIELNKTDYAMQLISKDMLKSKAKLKLKIRHSQIKILSSNDESYATSSFSRLNDTHFDLNVTPDTHYSSLCGAINILSSQKRQFSIGESEFIKALENGTPILVRGLACNLRLQQQLETLLETPASLIINGKRRAFDKATIYVLLSDEQSLIGSAWKNISCKKESLEIRADIQAFAEKEGLSDNDCNKLLATIPLLDQLFGAIRQLGSSSRKAWPWPAPRITEALLHKLVHQLRYEQKITGSQTLESEHWRKAIGAVILKEYRGHKEVYNWLKSTRDRLFPTDLDRTRWIDTAAMSRFCIDHPDADRDEVAGHFWQLSRSFSPNYFRENAPLTFQKPNKEQLDFLCECLILSHTENTKTLQASLSKDVTLKVSNTRERTLEKRIREYCVGLTIEHSMERDIKTGPCMPSSEKVAAVAKKIAVTPQSKISSVVQNELSEYTGTAGSARLVEYIVSGRRDWNAWNKKRNQRLLDAVRAHPIVSLKGDAGSGKSFAAQWVATKLNPHTPPLMFTAGPGTSSEDLFGRQILCPVTYWVTQEGLAHQFSERIQQALGCCCNKTDSGNLTFTFTEDIQFSLQSMLSEDEFRTVKLNFGDKKTKLLPGCLQRWAETPSVDQQPVVLIIDEANLMSPGALNSLKSMFGSGRSINNGGQKAGLLSPNHRVIVTGNPESLAGRNLDSFIRQYGVPFYYLPFDDGFLKDCILKPRIMTLPVLSAVQKKHCLDMAMTLWQKYRTLLPEHEFTPRDLHDISDKLAFYLQCSSHEHIDDVDNSAINTLIWESFMATLGGEVSLGKRYKLDALKLWFSAHFGLDTSVVKGATDKFEGFYTKLKLNSARKPDMRFSFSGQGVRDLAMPLWRQLEQIELEKASKTCCQGKHATLIEGPAGRGKDQLLRLLLQQKLETAEPGIQEPIMANAGSSSWQGLKEKIARARDEGRIIIISELNLLSSEYLEGELNDVLTGVAAPGFHLFATVNPIDYGGRHSLSSALSSRFIICRIDDYDKNELIAIARLSMTDSPDLARQLAIWHKGLCDQLRNAKHVLLPSTSDLKAVADSCGNNVLDLKKLEACFEAQYRLYLNNISGLTVEKCQPVSPGSIKSMQSLFSDDEMLQLYRSIESLPPVRIREATSSCYDPQAGVMTISDQHQSRDARALEIQRLLIENEWRNQGLSVESPEPEDGLLSAIYRTWQRKFSKSILREKCPSNLYRLSHSESQTFNLAENRPFINSAIAMLEKHDFKPSPMVFRALKRLLQKPALIPETKLSSTVIAVEEPMDVPSMSTEPGLGLLRTLSISTKDHIKRESLTEKLIPINYDMCIDRTFPDHHSENNRVAVIAPEIQDNGEVITVENRFGVLGYDWVEPGKFNVSQSLSLSEKLGLQTIHCIPDTWIPLHGLRNKPHSSLKAASIDQNGALEVIRDRSTGMYLFRWHPEESIPSGTKISITFVLEELEFGSSPQLLSGYQEKTCPATLKVQLDSLAVSNDFLKNLQAIATPDDKIRSITGYCKGFENLEYCMDKSNNNMLTEIINQKPGPSYFRSLAFWTLASWCNIPCRVVKNDIGGYWCEFSLDGACHWKPVQLGSKDEKSEGQLKENKSGFPDVVKDDAEKFQNTMLSFDMTDKSNAKNVAHYIRTIKPGSKEFILLYQRLPLLIGKCISESGDFSVEFIKGQLVAYHQCNVLDDQFLTQMFTVLKWAKKHNSSAIQCYQELWDYVVKDQKWLSPASAPDGTQHIYVEDLIAADYFEKVLTTSLERGTDIHITPEPEGQTDADAEMNEIIGNSLKEMNTPQLNNALYGDVPGDIYCDVPPGVLSISRLARQQPAFKQSALKPSLRPAMVLVPSMHRNKELKQSIEKRLKERIRDTSYQETEVPLNLAYRIPESEILNEFLTKQIHKAFLANFYNRSGGLEGNLKVLFPANNKEQMENKSEKLPDLFLPDVPNKPGFLKPATSSEFVKLAQISDDKFVNYNPELLSKIHVRQGFRESDLCLVTSSMMNSFQMEYIKCIAWPSLIDGARKSRAFKIFLEKRIAQEKINYEYGYKNYADSGSNMTECIPVEEYSPIIDDFV